MRMWMPPPMIAAVGWGSSFLFIKMGLEAFNPAQVGFGQLLVGAAGISVLVGAWDVSEFSLRSTVLMLMATVFSGIGGTLSHMLLTRVST